MAFNGYLLKVSGQEFNNKWIKFDTYKITPNQRQDLDSYRDANGLLHRNTLDHMATKVEFNTISLDNDQVNIMMSFLTSKFNPTKERKVSLEYYDIETNAYKSGTFYMPDIQFQIQSIDVDKNKIYYNSSRLAFIEY